MTSQNFFDQTPAKYDICISIVVVNGIEIGKICPKIYDQLLMKKIAVIILV
jgi:hypothetical protein